jgi:hypothetical protein
VDGPSVVVRVSDGPGAEIIVPPPASESGRRRWSPCSR